MIAEPKYQIDPKKKGKECWTDSKGCYILTHPMERKVAVENIKKDNWIKKEAAVVLYYKTKLKKNRKVYSQFLISRYELEKKFKEFAINWKRETGGYSTSKQIIKNKWYIHIIAMGPDVIPYILRELQNEPDYWFEALEYLAKPSVNPIPNDHYGDIEKMTDDWLRWAEENKYIE